MLAGMDVNVTRLRPSHAAAVVDCFHRVYGDSYANGLFYDAAQLADAMSNGRIYSVGAFDGDLLVGHMAMTIPHADAGAVAVREHDRDWSSWSVLLIPLARSHGDPKLSHDGGKDDLGGPLNIFRADLGQGR